MAQIPIWPGSSNFSASAANTDVKPTPYGFYDGDDIFTSSADSTAQWCARRLGYPLVDVELQDINFFTCFEEAVTEYGAQLYHFEIIDSFHTLEGNSTGSGESGSLNNNVITPNLGNTVNVADQYGSETDGGGGNINLLKGNLLVKAGIQEYDLLTNISSSISGSEAVYIKRVYHNAPPAIVRYFDPYAGTGTGIQSLMQTFGFGNFSPGVNFMLMPMYFDALKLQAIEMNDSIRKSAYHFELNSGKYLKLFPIPTSDYRLWFEYTMAASSNDLTSGVGGGETGDDDIPSPRNTITDMSNVPYKRPTYEFINSPGRQWIRKYCLAIAKEMLGGIRGKYQTIPIPGDDTTLDYSRLLSEASAEKESLMIQLREDLEATTTLSQRTRLSDEAAAEQTGKSYNDPYQIYIH